MRSDRGHRNFAARVLMRFTAGAVLGLPLAGCSGNSGEGGDGANIGRSPGALAQVNRAELREEELRRLIPPDLSESVTGTEIREILDHWVETELLYQRALGDGLDREPEVAETLHQMQRQIVANEFLQRELRNRVRVTIDEIRAYYDANVDHYTQEVHLRHIVLNAPEEAEQVLEQLGSGGDFRQLARRNSIDASASRGGDLGFLAKGAMNPAFEPVVFRMAPNEVRGPIASSFGFHIVQVVGRRKAADPVSFEVARDEILQILLLEKQQRVERQLLATWLVPTPGCRSSPRTALRPTVLRPLKPPRHHECSKGDVGGLVRAISRRPVAWRNGRSTERGEAMQFTGAPTLPLRAYTPTNAVTSRGRLAARALLLALVLSCTLAGSTVAQREPVDRVVALVDDEAILLSDVLQEMNLVRLQRNLRDLTEDEQQKLFRDILNGMIDDQLLVAQAKERGFEVGEQELNEAVEQQIRAIKEQLGGEEQYRAELQRQGFTEAEVRDMHRDQRRKQILATRVIQSEIRSSIVVTDDQVRLAYETQRDSIPPQFLSAPSRVRLADILITARVDDAKLQEAHAKINLALRRIEQGEDFAKVATEMSEWPTAQNGGFLGKFRYGDFESDRFDEAVSKLEPGELSDVLETRFGLMIIKLETRDGALMSARHIVVKTEVGDDAQVDALQSALEIRRRAMAGESFEDLARRYSDDPLTKDKGGVVEDAWALEELRPEFKAALDSLGVGEISDVVPTSNGYYIFKILERSNARDTSFEEIQEPLRRYLEQVELEKHFRAYVGKLRERFYVEVKV
jgi:parvulin-like peptidyl-prolyl isomerase